MNHRKDLLKVIAGHLGGKKGGPLSGGNFKRNKERARIAGQRSAWARSEKKLADYPLFYLDNGREVSL